MRRAFIRVTVVLLLCLACSYSARAGLVMQGGACGDIPPFTDPCAAGDGCRISCGGADPDCAGHPCASISNCTCQYAWNPSTLCCYSASVGCPDVCY